MVLIRKLSNGIPVILEQIEYFRSVSVGVYVKAGSAYESEENNGISHMLEHMFFKSTKNRTAKKLAEDMAHIGGNLNAFTEKECTSYYLTTLEEQLSQAIELLGDMLNHPLFLEDELEREKQVVLEEIDMYDDSPEDLVHEMLQKLVWKDYALGYIISGEKENVNRFTREDLIAYKETTYTSDRMVISIAGNFSIDATMELLEKHFSGFKPSTHYIEEVKPKFHKVVFCENKDIEQVHVNIAFDCISYRSEQKYALYLLNNILGGSDNSRLFQKLREESGLAYSVYSYESIYETGGLFHIEAIVNPSKLQIVLDSIEQVLRELMENGITDNELIQAKQLFKTDLIIGNESTKSKIYNNGKTYLMKNEWKEIDEIIERVFAVTKEEIVDIAKKYFVWNEKSLSFVGNITKQELTKLFPDTEEIIWTNENA